MSDSITPLELQQADQSTRDIDPSPTKVTYRQKGNTGVSCLQWKGTNYFEVLNFLVQRDAALEILESQLTLDLVILMPDSIHWYPLRLFDWLVDQGVDQDHPRVVFCDQKRFDYLYEAEEASDD